MEDIRKRKNIKKINILSYLKKIKFKHIIILILLFILFFPTISANIIGNWIVDFFVTIINIIK